MNAISQCSGQVISQLASDQLGMAFTGWCAACKADRSGWMWISSHGVCRISQGPCSPKNTKPTLDLRAGSIRSNGLRLNRCGCRPAPVSSPPCPVRSDAAPFVASAASRFKVEHFKVRSIQSGPASPHHAELVPSVDVHRYEEAPRLGEIPKLATPSAGGWGHGCQRVSVSIQEPVLGEDPSTRCFAAQINPADNPNSKASTKIWRMFSACAAFVALLGTWTLETYNSTIVKHSLSASWSEHTQTIYWIALHVYFCF